MRNRAGGICAICAKGLRSVRQPRMKCLKNGRSELGKGIAKHGFMTQAMVDACFTVDEPTTRTALRRRLRAPTVAELWTDFFSGRWKVAAQLSTETHCYLNLVTSTPTSAARAISPMAQRVFERVVLAEPQRQSRSRRVARVLACLRCCTNACALGLSCKFRRLPLPLLVHARVASRPGSSLSVSTYTNSLVVTIQRPDHALQRWLSPGEYSVARLAMEGKSHAEMAAVRGTSRRTVANQLQSVFVKLKISGRLELIRWAYNEPLS